MNNNFTSVLEIDTRIDELRNEQKRWNKLGKLGKTRAMNLTEKIKELLLIKQDMLNGTNNLQIASLEQEIHRLKLLRTKAMALKKMKYKRLINQKEEKLKSLKNKR